MSLQDDVSEMKELLLKNKDKEIKDKKVKKFNIPFGKRLSYKANIKKQRLLCILLYANKRLDFKFVDYYDGLLEFGEDVYKSYEANAVYNHKKYSVVVLDQTRLMPVGGTVEEHKWSLYGTKFDSALAEKLGIGDNAQRTIIRAVQKIEVDKETGKKKKKFPIVWLLIGGAVLVYLLAPALGL